MDIFKRINKYKEQTAYINRDIDRFIELSDCYGALVYAKVKNIY